MLWTEAMIDELKRLTMLPLIRSKDIASIMGMTRGAVIGKQHRLGIKMDRPSKGGGSTHVGRAVGGKAGGQVVKIKATMRWRSKKFKPVVSAYTEPASGLIQLFDLDDKHCHWPIGNPGEEGFGFCGQDKLLVEQPYCPLHDRVSKQRKDR